MWFQNRRAKERSNRQKQQSQSEEPASTQPGVVDGTPGAPLIGPGISVFATMASPGPSQPMPLSVHASLTRRRSLSTSALLSESSTPSIAESPAHWSSEAIPGSNYPTMSRAGPVRPRLVRHHTHAGSGLYTRPMLPRGSSRARHEASSVSPKQSTMPSAGSSRSQWTPSRGSAATLPHAAYWDAAAVTQFNASQPFGSGASLAPSQSSPPDTVSVAERRSNRLPPIKLLIDEIDTAMRDLPSSAFGPSTVQSCPSLVSPFERLELQSPLDDRSVHSEGVNSYFDQRRTQVPARYSPPVVAEGS